MPSQKGKRAESRSVAEKGYLEEGYRCLIRSGVNAVPKGEEGYLVPRRIRSEAIQSEAFRGRLVSQGVWSDTIPHRFHKTLWNGPITKEGKLTVERGVVRTETADFSPILQFEQDPVQILDALLPLYLNSQILRALQESLASELAARMSAMSNATDNAQELKKTLSIVYNRQRQAKITGEILEIVAGANALV
ncbi:hypothetical protein PTKIN_Ptkin01aG0140600 [Pterospermum kingtungense]